MTHQFWGGLPPHFWRLHFCKCLLWWKILNRLNSWFLDASFLGVNSVLLYTLLWKDLFATQRLLPKHKAHEKMENGAEFPCFYCLTKKESESLSRQRSKQRAPTRVCWASQTNIPDFTRSYSSYGCCWIWCCTFFKATKYHQLATQCSYSLDPVLWDTCRCLKKDLPFACAVDLSFQILGDRGVS